MESQGKGRIYKNAADTFFLCSEGIRTNSLLDRARQVGTDSAQVLVVGSSLILPRSELDPGLSFPTASLYDFRR